MRSAEPSGVGEEGFRDPKKPAGRIDGLVGRVANPYRRLAEKTSAITLAVGLTALLAASLSVIFDAARTISETEARQALVTHVAALGTPGLMADLIENEPDLTGVWQRGAGAFAVAFVIIGLTFRRRGFAGVSSNADLRRYQDLLTTIPFGVACWTTDGKMVVCNDHYRAQLNIDGPDASPGASYHASVARLVHGGYIHLLQESNHSRMLELHREDGSCLLIDERPLDGGGFVTLVSDVTETRRTDQLLSSIREEQRLLARRYHEEKLRAEAANRSKTAFLAHLSHDIRTPLNHIIGFAELIRQETYGPLGDARYLSYVEAMKGSGERLLSFFASILELAELEAGRRTLRQERVVVDSLLVASARRFSGQASQAGLTLTLGGPCDAVIVGDRFSLERMVGNLVENALRFTPVGGKVTLAAYAAADGVVLEITDTGIGIPPERLETLSQPFAFRDDVLTREQSGAGLGIAIARAIAESSGGRLAIDSRIGLGTTVAVSLPMRAAIETSVAA
jgi:two-component system cell cycle sensor histidine kinase PleC